MIERWALCKWVQRYDFYCHPSPTNHIHNTGPWPIKPKHWKTIKSYGKCWKWTSIASITTHTQTFQSFWIISHTHIPIRPRMTNCTRTNSSLPAHLWRLSNSRTITQTWPKSMKKRSQCTHWRQPFKVEMCFFCKIYAILHFCFLYRKIGVSKAGSQWSYLLMASMAIWDWLICVCRHALGLEPVIGSLRWHTKLRVFVLKNENLCDFAYFFV